MNPETVFWTEIADLLTVTDEIPGLGRAWRAYTSRVEALRAEEIT